MSEQRTIINRQKIQALYWLKAGLSPSLTDVAERLGVHRITVNIAVLNKMRYTPLATDAHGGLCPMPYARCQMPARAPHVTEKGYRWLKQYSVGGLPALLKIGKSTGRHRVIPQAVIAGLSEKLSEESLTG